MKLVVVESPAKAKTIQKYLGKGYTVKSSKGHIVDLPKSGLAVDVDKDFAPDYIVTKKDVLQDLKNGMKNADTLVLAVDPDREGEAIGWHIARELGIIDAKGRHKSKAKAVERIVFTEITHTAVEAAAKNPRSIDMNLVNAQQARRILDRLVGYKLSPLLWKKIRFGLSAGRVQSVAVRLIVDREREREKFKPEEYWNLNAYLDQRDKGAPKINYVMKQDEETDVKSAKDLAKEKGTEFSLTLIKDKKPELKKQTEVEKIIADVKSAKWKVADISQDQVTKNPPAPFSTSTLQQVAANRLGFSSARTMKIAQKLYEAGHITYMRTDSLHMSAEAITAVRKFITLEYGDKYLPTNANIYKTKSKVAQEAHEAVRPTHFEKTAASYKLDGDESKLYTLIRTRALGSQMRPALLESNTVKIIVEDYTFQAQGKRVLFPGYLEAYPETVTETNLPPLKVGQEMFPLEMLATQHFTEPPARFSEASLIKELERLGIGRPSTYAPIIQTIQVRKYVEKDGKYFFPTDTGKVVTDLLVKYFPEIVDAGFTAEMEDQLDTVANGELDWVKMLGDFYKPFDKNLVKQDKTIKRDEFTVLGESDLKCPECGKPMVIKLGRYGRFLSCSNFPDCKGMLSIDGESEADIQNKVNDPEFKQAYLPAPTTDDGRPFLLKKGRFGEFWAHPDYPKVKDARPLVMTPEKLRETYGEPPKTDDKREYQIKRGRFGFFWAHPDYPEVKDIIKIGGTAKAGAKSGRKFTKKSKRKKSK